LRNYILLFVLAFHFLVFNSFAQFLEFGAHIGVTSYSGDLKRGYNLSETSIAFSPTARFNFSEIVTARISLLAGKINGAEVPIDALAIQRDQTFSAGFLELSANFEYHFLDFKTENSRFNYSPYVFAGFGILNYSDVPSSENISPFQPIIPLGGGFKYLLNKKYVIGIEFSARKTFFDYVDGISGGDKFFKQDYNFGNPNDNDWYYFTSISFGIILHSIPCPFPYNPNKSILSR